MKPIARRMALLGQGTRRWAKDIEQIILTRGKCWMDWNYGLPGKKGEQAKQQLSNEEFLKIYLYDSKKRGGSGLIPFQATIEDLQTSTSGILPCPDPTYFPSGYEIPPDTRIWMLATKIEELSIPLPLTSFTHFYNPTKTLQGYHLRNSLQPVVELSTQDISVLNREIQTQQQQSFSNEDQLREYIAENWDQLDFGYPLEIYDDGEQIGVEYNTPDAGRMDFLARNTTSGDFVVIELKKTRSSDSALGQLQRYMGWVKTNFAEPENVNVRGLLLVGDEDRYLQYALIVAQDVELLIYKIELSLQRPAPDM